MNVVKQIRVDMNHGELFKVVQRWPCFDVFRSPFSVLSFVSVPVFQFCVLKFYRFEIAHLRRFRACFVTPLIFGNGLKISQSSDFEQP